MKYNLTDKLKFDEDPILQIRNTELTVQSGAENVLELLEVLQTNGEYAAAMKAVPILFSEKDQAKLWKLKLKMEDFAKVIKAAVNLAMGEDPDEEDQGE